MSIKSRFCPICGAKERKLIDGICIDCYFKTIKIKVPKEVAIFSCPVCGAVRSKGFWHASSEPPEKYLVQEIIEKLKLPPHVELENVKVLQLGKEGRIEIDISIEGKRFSIVKPVALYILERMCNVDSKKKSKIYKGILQIRASKNIKNFTDKVLSEAKFFSENILKVEELRTGADIYFLDVEPMRRLLARLKKKFKLLIKESAKAYGWDRTKNRPKYKITILIRQK